MIGIVAAGVLVVFIIVILVYLAVKLGPGAKTGRQVEVRVRSCEQKVGTDNSLYYEMKVDFYGANGEALERIMQSGKKYAPGEVIRCRYLEQTGMLFEDMTPEVRKKSRNNILLFLVMVVIFVGIVAVVFAEGGIPKEANRLVGYLVSVVFMAVGAFGIYNKSRTEQKMQGMISLPGVQVDYTINESNGTDDGYHHTTIYYHPVYEFEWGGEKRRIVGPVGASGKKYRAIGKKVHILVDPHTGQAICQEDERSKGNVYILFGVIGLAVLVLLLGLRLSAR